MKLNTPGKALFSTVWIGILAKGISILTTPLFTRLLGGEEYGRLAFYLSVIGIISGIVSPFVTGSQIYGIASKYKSNSPTIFLSGILPVLSIIGVICALLFTFSSLLTLNAVFILLITLQVLADSLILLYFTSERYNYKNKRVGILTVLEAVVAPIASILLIKLFGSSYVNRAFGILLPALLILLFLILYSLRKGRFDRSCSLLIFKSGAPLLPVSLLGALGTHADRLLIAFLLGNGAIAKYSVAHSLGAGLLFAVNALSASFIPWMLRRLDLGEEERIKKVSDTVIVILSCGAFMLCAFAPEAMAILAPRDYADAVFAVMPIALSAIPAFVSSSATAALLRFPVRGGFVLCKAVSLVAGIVSGLLLIPTLGYLGAGLAAFLAELSAALIYNYFLKKNKSEGISIKGSRLTLGVLFILIFLLPLFYGNLPVRILLMIIPSVILINIFSSERGLFFEAKKA